MKRSWSFVIRRFPSLISTSCFRDNLYNTNEEFDYGGFRELIEAQSQTSTSTTLFAYRFADPGVYVFYLSSDVNKRIVSAATRTGYSRNGVIFVLVI